MGACLADMLKLLSTTGFHYDLAIAIGFVFRACIYSGHFIDGRAIVSTTIMSSRVQ